MFRYYELLTDYSPEDVQKLKQQVLSKEKHPREVKVALAQFLVKRFHSEEAAQHAKEEFDRIFVNKGLPDEIPEVTLAAESQKGICALMVQLGLATSNSEASRLIQGGGLQLNQEKVMDPKLKLDLASGQEYLFKAGKKKFIKVVVK